MPGEREMERMAESGCATRKAAVRPGWTGFLAPATWAVTGSVVAVLDLFTGPYIHFPFFFLFPVGLAAWYSGRKAGIFLAFGLPLIRPLYFLEFWESGYDKVAVAVNVVIKILVFTAFAELIWRIGVASRFRAQILECLPLGMWVADRQGRIVQANPAGRALWDGDPANPVSETDTRLRLQGSDQVLGREEWALFRAVRNGESVLDQVVDLERSDGTRRTVSATAVPLRNEHGDVTGALLINQDITDARRMERERERLILSLEEAQRNVKILRGLLPVCASCKRIRKDDGTWQQIEAYIRDHSEVEFSHGICQDCMRRHYPEFIG